MIINRKVVGGGESSSGWQRPSAWGAYPLEFQQEKAKEDSARTMEAIYLLYHHNTDKYGTVVNFAGFKATVTGGYTVERGHMVGSTFTVDSTTSVASGTFYTETFTDAMPEYITYRIKPITSGNTFTNFAFGHTNSDLNAVPQMQIESYGRTKLSLIKSLFIKTHVIHVDVIGYGTVTTLQNMFENCYSLASLDCSGWDTSAVTTMQAMFRYCYSLTSLDCSGWDTSAVTYMSNMFQSCYSLTSLDCSGWDTSAVTTMRTMFQSCYSLTSLDCSGWDTSAVTSMGYMFYSCSSLTTLDCSGWDTSAVTNMPNMFQSCVSLASLDCSGWDTSAVTSMEYMFYSCYSLASLDCSGWDTSAVTTMQTMFQNCYSLTSLDCSGWDTSAVTNVTNMFNGCSVLIDLDSPIFYISVSFSNSIHLSHDSLMSIINNLATVSTTQTLTIGATNLAKLTSAEIAVATAKGWTVA